LSVLSIANTRLGEVLQNDGPIEIYRGLYGLENLPVVVKVVSQATMGTSIERRFRLGAAIHGSLHHVGIVSQLESGLVDDRPYTIEAFLPGGNLLNRLETGLSLQVGIKHIKDIANALYYMHTEGYVHGDIKPENLLVGINDQIHIADFSTVRKQTATPAEIFKGNSVLGTPEYMAPEALNAGPDVRSDIYSLGVTFYRMLTGRLPFSAQTAPEVFALHQQEPVPRLPEFLRELQSVLDKVLAKRPEQRYQTALEFIHDLDGINQAIELPTVNMKTQQIATKEIRVLSGGHMLSTVRDAGRQERLQQRSARKRRLQRTMGLAVLAIAIGYGSYILIDRQYVPAGQLLTQMGLIADPRLGNAWTEAQSLRQDSNQGLATIVAAYRRVLAIAPEHEGAAIELASLATDWKQEIAAALAANNLQIADTRLEEANSVFPKDLDWVNLNTELMNRMSAERIYNNTQTLLTSHGLSDLPSATAAIQSFNEVLRQAPGHVGAKEQLRVLAAHYAELSTNAVQKGGVNEGISLLERATAADNTLPQLDEVRKLISQATTAQAAIDELLKEARRLRYENKLMLPAGENAVELYHRVQATDPENVIAAEGLNEITAQVAADADALLLQGQLERVEILLAQAQAAALPEEGVGAIRARLYAERARQQTIAENLSNARSLISAGYLTQPAGENAVAKLREVQNVDPGNSVALQMLQICAQRLAEAATDAYEFGLVDDAEQYLDLALAISPDTQHWITLRDSWEANPSE